MELFLQDIIVHIVLFLAIIGLIIRWKLKPGKSSCGKDCKCDVKILKASLKNKDKH